MSIAGEKVALVTATWDSVRVEAYTDHIRMVACMASRLPPDTFLFSCEARKPIAESCTAAFNGALGLGADWILWLDDDVCPPADSYFRLREAADPAERPIVSALGFFRGVPFWPSIFEFDGWGKDGPPSIGRPMPAEDWPEQQLVQVDATGLTCTLIHRSVLEKVDRPWFRWSPDYSPDGYFMDQCARKKIPRYCHTGVIVDHLVTTRINDRTYRNWCAAHGGTAAARRMAVARFRLERPDWMNCWKPEPLEQPKP